MLAKYLIIVLLFLSLIFLLNALKHLARGTEASRTKLFHNLVLRLALCMFVFFFLIFSAYKGWIVPHAIASLQI